VDRERISVLGSRLHTSLGKTLPLRTCPSVLPIVVVALLLGGCSQRDPSWKPTFPLTGTVLVDGTPAEGVLVQITEVGQPDLENPTFSSAYTDAQGKFALSTYEAGDGVPEGEYFVTFMWGQVNMLSMQYGGPDKLNNRYHDPEKSEFRIRVDAGKPTDMGEIQLTTK
jgi:5-hydroxyisourate hydrolase-like protein (transthyretin family)